jgi:hypothetical protein
MCTRRSVEPFPSLLHVFFSAREPFAPFLRPTLREWSFASHPWERDMTLNATIVVALAITPVTGNATSTTTLSPEAHTQHAPLSEPSTTARSDVPTQSNTSLAKDASQGCDGQTRSATSLHAMLSRFVRTSSLAGGVQCPIPPISDQSTQQEHQQ